MEKKEIKKAFQKMSKQLKKQGINYTCVMNCRQMELGTATICFGYVQDYEALITKATASLADTEAIEKEVRQSVKEAARLLPMWRKWAQEDGEHAQYWKDLVAQIDAGTYEGKCRSEIIKRKETWLEEAKENFTKYGTVKEQYKKAKTKYEELISAQPVVEFLKLVNSKTILEFKNEHGVDYCYLRFRY